ncbi:HNH endonuclease [Parvibacter caecicola]|uniref:HNH endonuclease n=1 Tax=Parvibacter caecicola TaxID=747645 RepID=UPI00249C4B8B|nr:HNH endonuclease [Parvibacter caecicola]
MLITCRRCGRVHALGSCAVPEKPRRYARSEARAFRSSALWQRTAEEVRALDGNTCVVCMERDGSVNNRRLQVHHLDPLSETGTSCPSATDAARLATLCERCHEQAGRGDFSKEQLLEWMAAHRARFR